MAEPHFGKTPDLSRLYNETLPGFDGETGTSRSNGVLRNVHWYSYPERWQAPGFVLGSVGTLFYRVALKARSEVRSEIRGGRSHRVDTWLRGNINQQGRMHAPAS